MVLKDIDLIKISGGITAIHKLFKRIVVNANQIIKIKLLVLFLFR